MIKLTVSLVDDDMVYQLLTKKMLSNHSDVERVLQFYNGQEALEHFKSNIENEEELPDVLFLDIRMPIMDGWQFLESYRQVKPGKSPTIYMVSSSVAPEDVERARQTSEINDYIVKPITRDKLGEALSNAIDEAGKA